MPVRWVMMVAVMFVAACAPQTAQRMAQRAEGIRLAAASGPPILPDGYVADLVATDLPEAVDVAAEGSSVFVLTPRELWLLRAGGRDRLAANSGRGRWTAMALRGGQLVVAADGKEGRGRLLRLHPDGRLGVIFEGVRSGLGALTSPAFGPDGALYVAQGAASDAGLADAAGQRDVPCQDISLTRSGTAFSAGARARGAVPCHGAVLRVPLGRGGVPQLVAWGLREPTGLAVRGDGSLFVAERSYAGDGARQLTRQPDLFRRLAAGVWYGWPDFHGATALAVPPLIADPPNPPPAPIAQFAAGAEPGLFDFAGRGVFGGEGEAFIPLASEGRVVRVDPGNGAVVDFALGLGRPVAARFAGDGRALMLLDQAGGSLWRVRRQLEVAASPPG